MDLKLEFTLSLISRTQSTICNGAYFCHLAPPPSTHTRLTLTLKIAKSEVGYKVRFYAFAHLSHSIDELQWCIFLHLAPPPINSHSINLQNDQIHVRFGLLRQNFGFTKVLDGLSTVLSLDCIHVSSIWCTVVLSTWWPSNLQTPLISLNICPTSSKVNFNCNDWCNTDGTQSNTFLSGLTMLIWHPFKIHWESWIQCSKKGLPRICSLYYRDVSFEYSAMTFCLAL